LFFSFNLKNKKKIITNMSLGVEFNCQRVNATQVRAEDANINSLIADTFNGTAISSFAKSFARVSFSAVDGFVYPAITVNVLELETGNIVPPFSTVIGSAITPLDPGNSLRFNQTGIYRINYSLSILHSEVADSIPTIDDLVTMGIMTVTEDLLVDRSWSQSISNFWNIYPLAQFGQPPAGNPGSIWTASMTGSFDARITAGTELNAQIKSSRDFSVAGPQNFISAQLLTTVNI